MTIEITATPYEVAAPSFLRTLNGPLFTVTGCVLWEPRFCRRVQIMGGEFLTVVFADRGCRCGRAFFGVTTLQDSDECEKNHEREPGKAADGLAWLLRTRKIISVRASPGWAEALGVANCRERVPAFMELVRRLGKGPACALSRSEVP
jgi:hypothetical protein